MGFVKSTHVFWNRGLFVEDSGKGAVYKSVLPLLLIIFT